MMIMMMMIIIMLLDTVHCRHEGSLRPEGCRGRPERGEGVSADQGQYPEGDDDMKVMMIMMMIIIQGRHRLPGQHPPSQQNIHDQPQRVLRLLPGREPRRTMSLY